MRLAGIALVLVACGIDADPPGAGPDAPAIVPDAAGDADSSPPEGGDVPDAPSAPPACTGDDLCVDFEGAPPPAATTPNCSGTGTLALDTTVARSGTTSLRIDGGGGYCNHVFWTVADDALARYASGPVHVRFFVRFSKPLGEEHVTFLALRDASTTKDLRMGGQKHVLMWNRESDDATLPDLSPQGTAKSAAPNVDRFHCIEATLDPATGTIATAIDGVATPGLSTGGSDSAWSKAPRPFSPGDLRLGWESYGNASSTVWFDDLVVSTRPIGCD